MNIHLTVQVPHAAELDEVMQRFQDKLDPLLAAFQPELVQLQGRLVRHTSREGVNCRLNLHLPTGQLSGEATDATAQMAFREAGEELIRQLHKHKQRLRAMRPRRRIESNLAPSGNGRPPTRTPADRVTAQAEAEHRREELTGYFGGYYDHLLGFVQRQIAMAGELSETPTAELDPQEVLDEVIVAALEAEPTAVQSNRGRWLRMLAVDAMRRLHQSYGEQRHGLAMVSLETDPTAADEPDPEIQASMHEMMEQLGAALRVLPSTQRNDVVLHLIEGFRASELAQLSHRSRQEVETSLRQAAMTLEAQPKLPEMLRQRIRRGLEAAS